jgi:hypothetical protein
MTTAWCQRLDICEVVIQDFGGRPARGIPITPELYASSDGTTERCRRYADVRDGYSAW